MRCCVWVPVCCAIPNSEKGPPSYPVRDTHLYALWCFAGLDCASFARVLRGLVLKAETSLRYPMIARIKVHIPHNGSATEQGKISGQSTYTPTAPLHHRQQVHSRENPNPAVRAMPCGRCRAWSLRVIRYRQQLKYFAFIVSSGTWPRLRAILHKRNRS